MTLRTWLVVCAVAFSFLGWVSAYNYSPFGPPFVAIAVGAMFGAIYKKELRLFYAMISWLCLTMAGFLTVAWKDQPEQLLLLGFLAAMMVVFWCSYALASTVARTLGNWVQATSGI